MFENIKQVKKFQKKPDGIFGSFMTRPVSHIFAYWAYKIKLKPNTVSFISFILCVLSAGILYFYYTDYSFIIIASGLWWLAAILDASDGDLARYAKQSSDFGKWFDSYLDRIKEFMIFAVLGYIAFKTYNNSLYLVLGFLSVFSNVMSGYVSNTKDLFVNGRTPDILLNNKYLLGMVDTRDFFVILSLLLNEFRIALFCYSTIFVLVLFVQTGRFIQKYHRHK